MERPAQLFDREVEWQDLADFATGPGPGVRLAILRGRRRLGKSTLLRPLVEQRGGFYYQAVLQEQHLALADFGAKVGEWLGLGVALHFADWDEAFSELFEQGSRSGEDELVVGIDEFPYLLEHSNELPSILQRLIDASRSSGGPSVRLVLCGSALAVMDELLGGARPLRGRATVDQLVMPFDYRLAASFWAISDPQVAFHVHAVVGGAPGYRDMLSVDPPKTMAGFARWLERGVLNPSSALFREDDQLLGEERGLNDRALYHSVFVAIAGGKTRQSEIAAELARPATSLTWALGQLEEAGFIIKAQDLLRSRRPTYRLADPILRFHHVVTRPDIARFEARRTAEAWADAQDRFSSLVLGPHFEDLAREFTFRHADVDLLGGVATSVGTTVINDTKGRAQHEVDIVALDGDGRLLALGEAKHTQARRGLGDLERLEHIRALLEASGTVRPAKAGTSLLVFSAHGFSDALARSAQERPDVHLLALPDLYTA